MLFRISLRGCVRPSVAPRNEFKQNTTRNMKLSPLKHNYISKRQVLEQITRTHLMPELCRTCSLKSDFLQNISCIPAHEHVIIIVYMNKHIQQGYRRRFVVFALRHPFSWFTHINFRIPKTIWAWGADRRIKIEINESQQVASSLTLRDYFRFM